ncbi:TPA: hypothetical protein ACPSKY_003146 [Legionella bozemanae]
MISRFANYFHFLRCHIKKPPQISNTNIQKNVIVTMTTTPKRINKIWPTLNSIALQSQQPENILLWIPKQYKRFSNQSISQPPDFIKNYPNVLIQHIEQDYGPASKLLPCLQLLAGQDTKIIIIDDDRIYPPHFIHDLLKYEQADPAAALGIAGTVMHGTMRNEHAATKKMALVDVLLAYNGMLVKPTFFSEDIFHYPPNLPEAFFEDDVWVSGHLQKKNIRRVLIPSLPGWQSIILGNKRSMGLCMHENKDKNNFNRVFHYLFER